MQDLNHLPPQTQLITMVRRLIRFGTDIRLLTPQLPPAAQEKLTLAKLSLERAERLIAELAEEHNPGRGQIPTTVATDEHPGRT